MRLPVVFGARRDDVASRSQRYQRSGISGIVAGSVGGNRDVVGGDEFSSAPQQHLTSRSRQCLGIGSDQTSSRDRCAAGQQ